MNEITSVPQIQLAMLRLLGACRTCSGLPCDAGARLRMIILTSPPERAREVTVQTVLRACHDEMARGGTCESLRDLALRLEDLYRETFGRDPEPGDRPDHLAGAALPDACMTLALPPD